MHASVRRDTLKRYRACGVDLHHIPVTHSRNNLMSRCYNGKVFMGIAVTALGGRHYAMTLAHELAHAIMDRLWSRLSRRDKARWERAFGGNSVPDTTDPVRNFVRRLPSLLRGEAGYDREAYVTAYAASDPHEDWAETTAHFVMDRPALSAAVEQKYRHVRYFLKKYRTFNTQYA